MARPERCVGEIESYMCVCDVCICMMCVFVHVCVYITLFLWQPDTALSRIAAAGHPRATAA